MKKRNAFNETAYKTYKKLFEAIKRKSKKNQYSQKILTHTFKQILKHILKQIFTHEIKKR